MELVTTTVTLEQRQAARTAAELNYAEKLGTPDRPGWEWGKCPVTEYFGKIAELGAANFMGYDWQKLCLFSLNKEDYKRPDIGDWDVKAGSRFTKWDIAKGVRNIIWVTPWNTGEWFDCDYATCGTGSHQKLSGIVEVRGWTSMDDLDLCVDFGNYYKPTGAAFRHASTLPAFDWGDAA